MIKNKLVFCIVICLFLFSSAKIADKENKPELDVYGGYPKCIVNKYDYKYGVIDTAEKTMIIYKYNENGHWIMEARSRGAKYRTFMYDKNKNIVEKIFSYDPEAKDVWTHLRYKYNENNREIECTSLDPEGKINGVTKSLYNKINFISESIDYSKNGSIESKTIYNYSENNNLIAKTSYNSTGLILSRNEYTYDNFNNKTTEKYFDSNNEMKSSYEYKYDDNGNVLEVMEYDILEDESLICDFSLYRKYSFEYDNNGNIIEYTEHSVMRQVFINKSSGLSCSGESGDGGKYPYETRRYLDSNGNCIQKSIGYNILYKYDEYGNVVREVKYNELNEPIRRTDYIYSRGI